MGEEGEEKGKKGEMVVVEEVREEGEEKGRKDTVEVVDEVKKVMEDKVYLVEVVEEVKRVDDKVYPSPLLTHGEVVQNPVLFMETLRRFHSTMGTKFMIPVIGGKDLDLRLLYVEVTQRGGLEKVIVEKRWREVIAAFKFPPTTTSASFVLRKYYISLLHHFEQVYFFRSQGLLLPPAAANRTHPENFQPSPSTMHAKSPPLKLDNAESTPVSPQEIARNKKRSFSSLDSKVWGWRSIDASPLNFTVTGTIDGKFDHGYLVTVKMGSEVLRGVLFHVAPFGASTSSTIPSNAIVPYGAQSRMQRRRKKGWKNRDPAHPKPNRSAYNFFFADKHSKLKTLYPHREREFSKMIGESWNKLSEEERMVYRDCGLRDKERYKREMQEYRERLKLVQPMEVVRPDQSSRGED